MTVGARHPADLVDALIAVSFPARATRRADGGMRQPSRIP